MIQPYAWTKEEAAAIKALYATDAGRYVLDIIVHRLGMLEGMSFAGDPYTTAFQEGRRYVGGNLNNVLITPMDKIIREEPDVRHGPITSTERANFAAASSSGYAGPGRGTTR